MILTTRPRAGGKAGIGINTNEMINDLTEYK